MDFAKKNQLPIRFFSKNELNTVTGITVSEAALRITGAKGVAEPAAILAASSDCGSGRLLIRKMKKTGTRKKYFISGSKVPVESVEWECKTKANLWNGHLYQARFMAENIVKEAGKIKSLEDQGIKKTIGRSIEGLYNKGQLFL